MKNIIITLSFLLVTISYTFGQETIHSNSITKIKVNTRDIPCEELVQFRDNQLFNIWKNEQTKWQKYKLTRTTVNEFRQQKEAFEKNMSLGVSNWWPIVLALTTATEAFGDILQFGVPGGQVVNAIEESSKVAIRLYKGLNIYEKSKMLTSDEVEIAYQLAKEEGTHIFSYTSFLANLGKNLKKVQDHSAAQNEFNTTLKHLDYHIKRYEANLQKLENHFTAVDHLKREIDQRLRSNCMTALETPKEDPLLQFQAQSDYSQPVNYDYSSLQKNSYDNQQSNISSFITSSLKELKQGIETAFKCPNGNPLSRCTHPENPFLKNN